MLVLGRQAVGGDGDEHDVVNHAQHHLQNISVSRLIKLRAWQRWKDPIVIAPLCRFVIQSAPLRTARSFVSSDEQRNKKRLMAQAWKTLRHIRYARPLPATMLNTAGMSPASYSPWAFRGYHERPLSNAILTHAHKPTKPTGRYPCRYSIAIPITPSNRAISATWTAQACCALWTCRAAGRSSWRFVVIAVIIGVRLARPGPSPR